jgi:phospholipid/cholesterol/gamma-HCH transport system ATP-binding protein
MTVKENLEFPLVRNRKHLSQMQVDNEVQEVLDDVGLSKPLIKCRQNFQVGSVNELGLPAP